ncbi:Serine/threonine-protein kinase RAD53 [Paramyrothecium foliicola]|nr:Serine/threonine-protein kinase RAD53 [Paramyrothecium foliicola]
MASAENLENLPEFVRDSRLEAASGLITRNPTSLIPPNLGIGGGGTVDLQKRHSAVQGKPFYRAVKCVRVPEERPTHKNDKYARELEALVKFSQAKYSDLFVASLGWFTSRNHIHIAMEYCSIPEAQARDISLQLLDALLMMHNEGFAHRDLKPANILITSCPPHPWNVKLSDFGISKRSADSGESTTLRGTPGFMPPELLGFVEGEKIDYYAADMWCFGETLFRMLAGRPTFSYHAHLSDYARGSRELPKEDLRKLDVSEQAIDLFVSLLAVHPAKRCTAAGVSNHVWLDIVDKSAPLQTKENTKLSEIMETSRADPEITEASACWSTLPPAESCSQTVEPEQNETSVRPSRNCVLQSIRENKREIDQSSEKEIKNKKKSRLSYKGDRQLNGCVTETREAQNNRTLLPPKQMLRIEQRLVGSSLPSDTAKRPWPKISLESSCPNGKADDALMDTAALEEYLLPLYSFLWQIEVLLDDGIQGFRD